MLQLITKSNNRSSLKLQGPCYPREWLILKQSPGLFDRAICVENPCPKIKSDNDQENQFWFPFGGMCYQTGTQGFCRESKYRVYIMKNGFSPLCLLESTCSEEGTEEDTTDTSPTEPCNRNRTRRYVGKCRKKTTFSFPKHVLTS